MDKADLDALKAILEEDLNSLLKRADSTVHQMAGDENRSSDLIDIAAAELERNYTLRIRGRESRLIGKIKDALTRMEEGTYGICERCGEEIAVSRLMARPVTCYCIQCKTILEKEEAALGN